MKYRIIQGLVLSILLLITSSSFVYAQLGGQAGAYTRYGTTPRAIAAGNSWVAYANEGAFIDYNPAFAAYDSSHSQLSLSTALLQFDRQLHVLQGTTPLPPYAGFGFLLRTSRITDFDGRTLSGYPTGKFSSTELQLMGAFGIQISKRLSLGAGFKYNYANLHPDLSASTSIGLDFGVHYRHSEWLQFGVSVQDLLSFYEFTTLDLYGGNDNISKRDEFPTRIHAGTAIKLLDSLQLTVSAEYQIQKGEEISYDYVTDFTGSQLVRSTEKIRTGFWQGRFGLSYPIHSLVTLRTGWQWLNLSDMMRADLRTISGGFSIRPPLENLDASIDYAIMREPSNLGFAHVFAIHIYL